MFLVFILVANLCIHAAKGYTVLQIEIIIKKGERLCIYGVTNGLRSMETNYIML